MADPREQCIKPQKDPNNFLPYADKINQESKYAKLAKKRAYSQIFFEDYLATVSPKQCKYCKRVCVESLLEILEREELRRKLSQQNFSEILDFDYRPERSYSEEPDEICKRIFKKL